MNLYDTTWMRRMGLRYVKISPTVRMIAVDGDPCLHHPQEFRDYITLPPKLLRVLRALA